MLNAAFTGRFAGLFTRSFTGLFIKVLTKVSTKVFTVLALRKSTLKIWIAGLLLGSIASFICDVGTAHAAETVILNFRDTRISVSNQEFEAFVNDTVISQDLQAYFQKIPLTPEDARYLLTEPIIPKISLELNNNLNQFLAIQLNKLMGEPYGRESLNSLQSVVVSVLADDKKFSILELIDQYPEPIVKVYLGRLDQVHRDVNLFIERVQPILQQADGLLQDLVCECAEESPGPALMSSTQGNLSTPVSAQPCENSEDSLTRVAFSQAEFSQTALIQAGFSQAALPQTALTELKGDPKQLLKLSESQNFKTVLAQAFSSSASSSSTASSSYKPPRLAQDVVITFGPLARSISIDDLTTLAETGISSRSLKSLLGLAKVSPESFRSILNRQVKVSATFLDKNLNNVLGEFALFQMGQIVQTGSGQSNIQALRSTLILSAQDDDHISLVEFLQNYPLPQIYLDGAKLAKLASAAKGSNSPQNLAGNQVRNAVDFLVSIQRAIAAEVCSCDGKKTP